MIGKTVNNRPTVETTANLLQKKAGPGDTARKLLEKVGPLIGLIVVVMLFTALRHDQFFTAENAQLILMQTAVVGIAALGMTMVIVSAGIDLSVGSNIALCTVIIARVLTLPHSHVPPLVAALAGILVGATVGLFISAIVSLLRITPFIVTLGLWGAIRGMAIGVAGGTQISTPDSWLRHLLDTLDDAHRWVLFPPGVWLFFILSLFISLMLKYTKFGRHIFAIGSNEQTARLCGVPVQRTKMWIYTIAGALAGVASILQFSYLSGEGDPTTANGYELNIIAAVVIGGASLSGGLGSVFGTIIGAIIMTTIGNGCVKMGWDSWVQQIVTGSIIILAVAVDRLRHRTAA